MNVINRREALKRAAYIMGGTLMVPTVAGVLKGCTPKPTLNWSPAFFTEDQARLVTAVSDIIMPKTDTPAASEVGVPGFIEEMVSVVYPADRKKAFMDSLAIFQTQCKEVMGSDFNDLDLAKQSEFVNQKHDEIKGKWIAPDSRPFIYYAKELTVLGYCLTEVGSTQLLQHVMIPTRYDGCIPVSEAGNGKRWAMT